MGERRFKQWGWGYADQVADAATMASAARGVREMFGFGQEPRAAAPFDAGAVPRPRLGAPAALESLFSDDPYERTVRAMGKAYRDIVRGFYGQGPPPPDLVARPRSAADVEEVLAWAEDARAAVIPFGGGTSVVGGVEARLGEAAVEQGLAGSVAGDYRGVICLDMRRMDRVLEVDPLSLAARVQAGATGPSLEEQLREQGLTLRFYPQSFEFSTLGGWIATRAGGHFATGPTHIEDSVESLRAVTPRGEWVSRRVPSSGAGPSPDRLLAGSEGTLGVITEAWLRVLERPRFKASATVGFAGSNAAGSGSVATGGRAGGGVDGRLSQALGEAAFRRGAAAVRALVQSGLPLANCRLVDPLEARTTGAGDGSAALLLLGFESAALPIGDLIEAAIGIAREHGGSIAPEEAARSVGAGGRLADLTGGSAGARGETAEDSGGAAGQWRNTFLFAPYLRDTFVACGVLSETFETATTWDRFDWFHKTVSKATRQAVAAVCNAPVEGEGAPRVSCRLTHVYRDGAALYFTVLAPAIRGGEVEQWDEIKAAVSEAIIAAGGTITHHHAVGRDHRPYYDSQRPDPFAAALRAAKKTLDPAAVLNPGVLVDP